MSELLLAIDTCGATGGIALATLDGESLTVLGEAELAGKTYSAQLIPAIRQLLSGHRCSVTDLNAIVVTSGPGSFTGIRIGVSTAKGLAEAGGTPILAVSRLAVLAHKAGGEAATLDASRHEFYFGSFRDGSCRESLLTADAFAAEAHTFGAGLAVCEASAHERAPQAVLVPPPAALDALRFALPRLRTGQFSNTVTLDGNYLRRSDAEIFAKSKLVAVSQP